MKLDPIRNVTDKILKFAIIVLFLTMFGVTTLNVFMRYVMNKPLSFSVELGRYTFCGIVYLGSIFVMREDGHIGLDIIVDALPKKVGFIVRKIARILVLIYLAIFLYESGRMVATNWANRSSTMQIPMSVIYMFMVVGSFGMFIEEFLYLIGKGGSGESNSQDVQDMGGGM